jgi:phage gp36-like protein
VGYASSADVERAAGGSANLIALTDTDANGVADVGVVDAAIAEADAVINSYASKRFAPNALATLSAPALTALSARMSVRILRRNRGTTLAADVEQEKIDQKWLEDLAAGKVLPGTQALPEASSIVTDEVGERESTKAVSREALKGFW